MSDPEGFDRRVTDTTPVDDARRRLREQGIVSVEPDARIGVMLESGEHVVAVRRAVTIERRTDVKNPDLGLRGDLYVTTARLVHLGLVPVEVPLGEIREADVATGVLRLVVGDGRGVEIRIADPDLLRLEIAAVREAVRITAGPDATHPAPPAPGARGPAAT